MEKPSVDISQMFYLIFLFIDEFFGTLLTS